ncbi:hypothetical protein NIES2100_45240 [Calothrix sp. NIES-2100]|uniref:DUF1350 family protein n=1 Tax=Calothrix sp. NIES-2100 TaxID=1954172 RepID=UPI000B5EC528|nr:hypothetical protein NIES2100_45240 [Calothrix sp. NIES-2100]
MDAKFELKPLYFNWVALHPQPIGVIQFIGGAFFGTFPTIFYRYLFQKLFEQGYTIVALPFRFSFRHWSVAIGLAQDQVELRKVLLQEAKHLGYDYTLYQEDSQVQDGNYFWLGHSLGCKYIALLEILSDLEVKEIQDILGKCVGEKQYQEIENQLQATWSNLDKLLIKGQPSLLMAPTITDLGGAIPHRFLALAKFIENKLGLKVLPTVEQTHCLIERSSLFNLTGLIAFAHDSIASATVDWLKPYLSTKKFDLLFEEFSNQEFVVAHLTPLGMLKGNPILIDKILMFFAELSTRATKPSVS